MGQRGPGESGGLTVHVGDRGGGQSKEGLLSREGPSRSGSPAAPRGGGDTALTVADAVWEQHLLLHRPEKGSGQNLLNTVPKGEKPAVLRPPSFQQRDSAPTCWWSRLHNMNPPTLSYSKLPQGQPHGCRCDAGLTLARQYELRVRQVLPTTRPTPCTFSVEQLMLCRALTMLVPTGRRYFNGHFTDEETKAQEN